MNVSLLKKMLPGLIPLIIFILADEIWGTRVGLLVALGTGLAEMGYYYVRDRRIDSFILLDTGLLIVLGVISILIENDIFFKIKPALIEAILLLITGFSLWGPTNLILAMSVRYMGKMELDKGQERMMRLNMIVMFWITAFHILLVIYSAVYMSKEAWGFISGGLYYILFGLYFAALWFYNRYRAGKGKDEEWFPVVDEEGKIVGVAPRSVCHDGKSMLLHPVVHLHLFNKEGKLFLQKRSMNKDIQPGRWDTSVGGHVAPGEMVEDALKREASEEISLKVMEARFSHKYIWESDRERELVFSFITVTDLVPGINTDEIDEGRFWSIPEIEKSLGLGIFTPNFEQEFKHLKEKLI